VRFAGGRAGINYGKTSHVILLLHQIVCNL
jgi:hypothetical protein